jgi:hypothetical protein
MWPKHETGIAGSSCISSRAAALSFDEFLVGEYSRKS